MKRIKKAILPVAGFGTRFLPATKAQPKEMLAVYDQPAIQYIIEDAIKAGITQIVIVTGRGKRAIEDHFDTNLELEALLEEKQKTEELELVRKISSMADVIYVRQPKALGDGHAILCAEPWIEEGEDVVVLFGDDIVDNPGGKNSVEQLLEVYNEHQHSVVMLEEVPNKDVSKYGVVDFAPQGNNVCKVNKFVEKPSPEEAPSNLAVVGKYILTYEVLQQLKQTKASPDGEIRLANAFSDFLEGGGTLCGKTLDGIRFDTGDKLGFLRATVYFAAQKEGNQVIKDALDFDFLK